MSLTGHVAGDTPWATYRETVWLYEGYVEPGEADDLSGYERPITIREAKLHLGDIVELFDDAAFTESALEGSPVVRKCASTGASYIGKIVEIDLAERRPAARVTALADLVAGRYMRKATVEFLGQVGRVLTEVTIPANTPADVVAVGSPTSLAFDVSDQKFVFGTGTNNKLVPLTRVAGATGADTTAAIVLGIGLQTIEKVA